MKKGLAFVAVIVLTTISCSEVSRMGEETYDLDVTQVATNYINKHYTAPFRVIAEQTYSHREVLFTFEFQEGSKQYGLTQSVIVDRKTGKVKETRIEHAPPAGRGEAPRP